MRYLIGTIMVVMLLFLAFRPRRWVYRPEPDDIALHWITRTIFFIVAMFNLHAMLVEI